MPWDINSPSRHSIALPNGRLRYPDIGTGDPVVFIHGLMVCSFTVSW